MRLTASDFYRHYRRAGRCSIGKMVSMGTMMGSRRATSTLALICVLALASPARWASAATVAEIAKNPVAFDQKTVTASGTAEEISSRTSRRGNPYTTFRLSDRGEAVKVFTFGTPAIKDGQRVEVRGVFQRVKQVGAYTFHDEIDASFVNAVK